MNQRSTFRPNLRNGWILCSSKTFPGKSYYFNVQSGEKSWAFNEIEKPRCMPQNMPTMDPQMFQTFPEPTTPPFLPYQPYYGFQNHSTPPQFGNTSFPNYLQHDIPSMQPNIKAWNQRFADQVFINHNKNEEPLSDYKLMVQTTSLPLNSRFLNIRFPYKFKVQDEGSYGNVGEHLIPTKKKRIESDDTRQVQIIQSLNHPVPAKVFESRKPGENIFHRFNQNFSRIDKDTNQSDLRIETGKNTCRCPVNHAETETVSCQHLSRIGNINRENQFEYNQERHQSDFNHTRNGGFNPERHQLEYNHERNQPELVYDNEFEFNQERHLESYPKIHQTELNQEIQEPEFYRTRKVPEFNNERHQSNHSRQHSEYNHERQHSEYNHETQEYNQQLEPEFDQEPTLDQQGYNQVTESFQKLTRFDQVTDISEIPTKENPTHSLNRSLFSPVNEEANEELPKTDLRLLLLAKRKKYGNGSKDDQVTPEVTKFRTMTMPEQPKSSTKKVSFSLNNCNDDQSEHGYDISNDVTFLPHSTALGTVQDEVTFSTTSDTYFVISDTAMLLDHWAVLGALLNSEGTYKILLPQKVTSDLEKICVGSCRGRHDALRGRHAARLVAEAGDKILKEDNEPSDAASGDPIIDCFQKFYERGYQVILLTSKPEIESKANENYVTYFNIEEIKQQLSAEQQDVTFDSKNYKKNKENQFFLENKKLSPILKSKYNFRHHNEFRPPSPILESKSPRKMQKYSPKNVYSRVNETVSRNDNKEKSTFGHNSEIVPHNDTANHELLPEIVKPLPQGTIFEHLMTQNLLPFKIPKLASTNQNAGRYSPFNDMMPPIVNKNIVQESIDKLRIEDEMERFDIKNGVMEERLTLRKEEWICQFTQLMEDALTLVLMNADFTGLPPPWSFREAIDCIKRKFNWVTKITFLAEKLANLLFQFDFKGTINPDIQIGDLMRLLGFGVLLIEALVSLPDYKELLQEPDCSLKQLLEAIESPTADVWAETPKRNFYDMDYDEIILDKGNRVYNAADVTTYLRQNFPHLRECYEETGNVEPTSEVQEKPNQIKIIRMIGKNIDKLKFNSKNQISMVNQSHVSPHYDTGNTFQNDNEKTATKVVRNLSVIKEFEDRIKVTNELDLDMLDYEGGDETPSLIIIDDNDNETSDINRNDLIVNDMINGYDDTDAENEMDALMLKNTLLKDWDAKCRSENKVLNQNSDPQNGQRQDHNDIDNDIINDINDTLNDIDNDKIYDIENDNNNDIENDNRNDKTNTSDSGFIVSEDSSHVQSVIKTFYNEIKETFLTIYNFIKASVTCFEGNPSNKRKRNIEKKTEWALKHIDQLIDSIKSIIERENSNSDQTVKMLISKINVEGNDPKILRYCQVLKKCLEQAEVLSASLKILQSVLDHQCARECADIRSLFNEIPYFNIFE